MWNAGLNEAQTEIKIAERNILNFRYADDTTLMAKSEEELKSFLMRVKKEVEKAGLKLNIWKTVIMHPVPSLHGKFMGNKRETVTDFIFWAPKSLWMVTAVMELKGASSLEKKIW